MALFYCLPKCSVPCSMICQDTDQITFLLRQKGRPSPVLPSHYTSRSSDSDPGGAELKSGSSNRRLAGGKPHEEQQTAQRQLVDCDVCSRERCNFPLHRLVSISRNHKRTDQVIITACEVFASLFDSEANFSDVAFRTRHHKGALPPPCGLACPARLASSLSVTGTSGEP
jgi:hypothetical protein